MAEINTVEKIYYGSGLYSKLSLMSLPAIEGKHPDDAHGHEHTEQDVVKNHDNKLPLLCPLEQNKTRMSGNHAQDYFLARPSDFLESTLLPGNLIVT